MIEIIISILNIVLILIQFLMISITFLFLLFAVSELVKGIQSNQRDTTISAFLFTIYFGFLFLIIIKWILG